MGGARGEGAGDGRRSGELAGLVLGGSEGGAEGPSMPLRFLLLLLLVQSQSNQRKKPLTLPVAPEHAPLASSITTLSPLPSSPRYLAAFAPVSPLPTITTSA